MHMSSNRVVASAVQVFSCSFTEAGRQESVVLKVMDMPKSVHDSCRQVSLQQGPLSWAAFCPESDPSCPPPCKRVWHCAGSTHSFLY